jgi:hypothetical protein
MAQIGAWNDPAISTRCQRDSPTDGQRVGDLAHADEVDIRRPSRVTLTLCGFDLGVDASPWWRASDPQSVVRSMGSAQRNPSQSVSNAAGRLALGWAAITPLPWR